MASESRLTTLGDLIDKGQALIQTGPFGSQLHASDYTEKGVSVIPTEAIGKGRILNILLPKIGNEKASELRRHILRRGDIVFARRGIQATGLSALIDEAHEGALCGTGAILLRILSNDIDPMFLSLYLSADSTFTWLRTNAVGAVMPNLNVTVLRGLPLYLPKIEEQKSIAETLMSLGDKIELNRKMNATLEQMVQALFKSWFVDFDPVKAKAAGLIPEGIDAETVSLFPSEFEERELEAIPKGWSFVSLDQLFDLIGGGTPKTSNPDFWNGDVPWFSVVDAPAESDVFVIDTEKKITQLGLSSSSTRMLRKGVTIISARGTVGKLAVVATPMAMNQSCYALDGKYGDFFTYYSTNEAVATLKQNTHGAVFDTITRDTFKTAKAVLPTPSLCQAFEDSVSPLMRQIETNLRQSRLLTEIRDSLLPKLISGQIRIRDIEA